MPRHDWPIDETAFRPPPALRKALSAQKEQAEKQERRRLANLRATGLLAAHRSETECKRHEHRVKRLKRLHEPHLQAITQIVECHADVYGVSVDDILFARRVSQVEIVQDSVIFHMISEGIPQRAIECAMGMGWATVKTAFGRHIARVKEEH